jgi:DNA-binding CsgD family transcriptional regulator
MAWRAVLEEARTVDVDLRNAEWLDLTADLVSQAPTDWPAERIGRQLTDTFRAVGCAFYIRTLGEAIIQGPWPPERFANRLDEIRRWSGNAAACHPILRYCLATGDCRVMQVDDVPGNVAPPRLVAAWVERGREWGGVQHQLALPLLMTPQAHRAFVIGRPDPFTPQELELGRHLRHLLSAIDLQIRIHSQWVERAGCGEVGLVNDVKLTPRELTVLSLMAEGRTASSIGRKLMISERTVHKHLERTYAKLGVADRLCAVLRAYRIGLLPGL